MKFSPMREGEREKQTESGDSRALVVDILVHHVLDLRHRDSLGDSDGEWIHKRDS